MAHPWTGAAPLTARSWPAWPAWLATVPVLLALGLGFEGWRLLQMLVLAGTAWVFLLWPARSRHLRAWQAGVVALLALAFMLDAGARLYLRHSYEASPSSAMVMAAVANTDWQESMEYLRMQGPRLGLPLGALAVAMGWLLLCLRAWWRAGPAPRPRPRAARLLAGLLLASLAIALLSKPWRNLHPLLFWPGWLQSVADLRQQWGRMDAARQALHERAAQQGPQATAASPETLVLVLSESINRQHLSIYGYPRPTSPRLAAKKSGEAARLQVFDHAWSVDASTLPALRNFFHFGDPEGRQQHLLALAAAAGYQTWWISNQDDVAIEHEHARLAQQVRMLGRQPGRGSRSLDHHSLPVLEQALASPAARKLIVVHLIGAHPDYRLRHVAGQARFQGVRDEVYQGLKAQGRSKWVRERRNDYDSALHYHDAVVAETLALTRRLGGRAVWMYLSDHGQDVGTSGNRAGHSVNTAEGYRIPLLMWGQHLAQLPDEVSARPVRSDWLGHSVMSLLGLAWPGQAPQRDVLDPRYRWQAPAVPPAVHFES